MISLQPRKQTLDIQGIKSLHYLSVHKHTNMHAHDTVTHINMMHAHTHSRMMHTYILSHDSHTLSHEAHTHTHTHTCTHTYPLCNCSLTSRFSTMFGSTRRGCNKTLRSIHGWGKPHPFACHRWCKPRPSATNRWCKPRPLACHRWSKPCPSAGDRWSKSHPLGANRWGTADGTVTLCRCLSTWLHTVNTVS